MAKKKLEKHYFKVRVESPGSACGYVGHMTADELKKRAAHDSVELSCPVCGLVHLSKEEIEERESQLITDSPRYRQILEEIRARE